MSEAFWALGRGSGVVLIALTTITLLLGILTRSGRPLIALPRFGVTLVHRNVALLTVAFLAIHVLSLLGDPYAQLRIIDLVVPFAGKVNPLALGLGTVGLDLMVAVTVTGLLRARIGVKAFKTIHWLAYGAWPIAIVHGLAMGSDAGTLWYRVLTGAAVVGVIAAVVWRMSTRFVEYRAVRVKEIA